MLTNWKLSLRASWVKKRSKKVKGHSKQRWLLRQASFKSLQYLPDMNLQRVSEQNQCGCLNIFNNTYGSAASAWCAVWSWAKWSFHPDHRRFCRERSPQPQHYWWVTRNKSLNTHKGTNTFSNLSALCAFVAITFFGKSLWKIPLYKTLQWNTFSGGRRNLPKDETPAAELYTAKSLNYLPNHQVITLKKHFLQKELISSGVFGGNVVLHTPNSPWHSSTFLLWILSQQLKVRTALWICVLVVIGHYLSKSSSSSSSAMAHSSSSSRSTIIASIWGTGDTSQVLQLSELFYPTSLDGQNALGVMCS